MSSPTTWQFVCAGTFAGVSSFTNEQGEELNFLKIDFFGGKVSVPLSDDDVDKFDSKPVGASCRIQGSLFLNNGLVKPQIEGVSFEGEADFQPVTIEEHTEGMVFRGFARVLNKVTFDKKDGSRGYKLAFMADGCTLEKHVDREVFDETAEGFCYLRGVVLSEVQVVFENNQRSNRVRNDFKILAFSPYEQKARKR